MQLRSNSLADGGFIPDEFAFGRPGPDGAPFALSDNRNPHLAWSGVPDGTRSFVLTCIDADAPGAGDDVNREGREVAADLPRVDFVHWLMADIPPECGELGAGSCCDGVVAHGKHAPPGPPGTRQGTNDYSGWFAGDAAMAGDYRGYDGPCPPWNDARAHRYTFELNALDVPTLGLDDGFRLADLRRAMAGHVLASASICARYAINRALRA
jgi:Raf kinase inhibitor-like YbhB/YbcL family protein